MCFSSTCTFFLLPIWQKLPHSTNNTPSVSHKSHNASKFQSILFCLWKKLIFVISVPTSCITLEHFCSGIKWRKTTQMWQKQQAKKPIRHWEKGENTFMCETWSDVHNRFQFIILKKADFYYLTENTFLTSQKWSKSDVSVWSQRDVSFVGWILEWYLGTVYIIAFI